MTLVCWSVNGLRACPPGYRGRLVTSDPSFWPSPQPMTQLPTPLRVHCGNVYNTTNLGGGNIRRGIVGIVGRSSLDCGRQGCVDFGYPRQALSGANRIISAAGFPLQSGYGLDLDGADYPDCTERSTSSLYGL